MAKCTDFNHDTGCAEFSIESASEISLLPTTTTLGSGDLAKWGTVIAGSRAFTDDGKMDWYTLDAADTWNKVIF